MLCDLLGSKALVKQRERLAYRKLSLLSVASFLDLFINTKGGNGRIQRIKYFSTILWFLWCPHSSNVLIALIFSSY